MAAETKLPHPATALIFCHFKYVLEKGTLHGPCMGRRFPGVDDRPVTAATKLGAAHRFQIKPWRRRVQQQNKKDREKRHKPPPTADGQCDLDSIRRIAIQRPAMVTRIADSETASPRRRKSRSFRAL